MNGYPSFYPRIVLVAPSPVVSTTNAILGIKTGMNNQDFQMQLLIASTAASQSDATLENHS